MLDVLLKSGHRVIVLPNDSSESSEVVPLLQGIPDACGLMHMPLGNAELRKRARAVAASDLVAHDAAAQPPLHTTDAIGDRLIHRRLPRVKLIVAASKCR